MRVPAYIEAGRTNASDCLAAWVRFAIASTPRRLDRESGKWIDGEPLFLDCTAWREFAEQITESLSKGMRVVATGRLRQRSWETDDGQKRTAFELDLEDIGPSLLRRERGSLTTSAYVRHDST
jgi:single-stranded DNA-binding protein